MHSKEAMFGWKDMPTPVDPLMRVGILVACLPPPGGVASQQHFRIAPEYELDDWHFSPSAL